MEVNADFSKRVVIHTDNLAWQASPMPGVDRRMLDRIGGEVARATSIVRYAPDSRFSSHVHHGGEEFFVLDGVFQDEHGDYPAGSYLRNPPTSRHTPGSAEGCVIFVKLWQFDPDDRTHVNLNFNETDEAVPGAKTGVTTRTLYEDAREKVQIIKMEPNEQIAFDAGGGLEAFVLSGSLTERGDVLDKRCWLRIPVGETVSFSSGGHGAVIWIKTGHLRDVSAPAL